MNGKWSIAFQLCLAAICTQTGSSLTLPNSQIKKIMPWSGVVNEFMPFATRMFMCSIVVRTLTVKTQKVSSTKQYQPCALSCNSHSRHVRLGLVKLTSLASQCPPPRSCHATRDFRAFSSWLTPAFAVAGFCCTRSGGAWRRRVAHRQAPCPYPEARGIIWPLN